MSELIKVTAPEIGMNKAKSIKPTNKLMRRIWSLQLKEMKLSQYDGEEITDENVIELYEKSIENLDDIEDFLVDVLSLNKTQKDKLEDLTQVELEQLAVRVQMTILQTNGNEGPSDEEVEPDPK